MATGPREWNIAVPQRLVDGQKPGSRIALMGRRISCILVVVLSVLVVPALCMGGVLLHPCECCHEDECGHEDACASDPCPEWVVRNDDFTHDVTEDQPSAAPAQILNDEACFIERRLSAAQTRPVLPFPASDIPLLI